MQRRTWVAAAGAGIVAGRLGRALRDRVASGWAARQRGRVALVTGGSRGLGLLIARELGARGFRLAICARDHAELAAAESELAAAGVDVLPVVCDVADREQVNHLVRSVIGRFGRLDVLVNNAGIIEVAPVSAMTVEDFGAAQKIMFWGPLYATLAALPHLRAGRGHVINVTSIGGKISAPHLLPYNCAKFAAVGLSEGLRAELAGTGVTVTTVVPGLMRTGSHLRAWFKGQHRREFAWFAVAASLPGLAMSARRAARRAVRAGLAGRAEVVMTPAAQLAVLMQGLLPGTVPRVLGAANRLLPSAAHPGPAVPGLTAAAESDSRLLWALTPFGRRAARRYQHAPLPSR